VDALDEKIQVSAFLEFLLENQRSLAEGALFVPLTEEQATRSRTELEGAASE
jgi:hypothetical protein